LIHNPKRRVLRGLFFPGSLKANVTARVGRAMAIMADSGVTLRVDQNGAEELTPPRQAILVRDVETLKVMSPYLPDDERAQRLAALRLGGIELTDIEKLVVEAAKGIMQKGGKVTMRAVKDALPDVPGKKAEAALKHVREQGLLGILDLVATSQDPLRQKG
jgi:hypothetical protein